MLSDKTLQKFLGIFWDEPAYILCNEVVINGLNDNVAELHKKENAKLWVTKKKLYTLI